MHGGLGFDHTILHPGLDHLGKTCELVYYDHRGHGQSGHPPLDTLTWEQLAHDAEGLRRHRGYQRICIIAHSVGTFPALEYALRYPQALHRLILIAAVPAFDHFPQVVANMRARGASDELVACFYFSRMTSDEVFKKMMYRLGPMYFHKPTEELVQQAFGRMQCCAESCRRTPSLIQDYSLESKLHEVKVPTLVLAGGDDFVVPLSQVKRLSDRISTSTTVVFELSGHFPYLEEPARFLNVVQDWLATAS
jgi:proline iminopeptidase